MSKMDLLIGINTYPAESGLAALRHADGYGREMASTLKRTCGPGVQLVLRRHVPRYAMEQTLLYVGASGNSLFFFAGHGPTLGGRDGRRSVGVGLLSSLQNETLPNWLRHCGTFKRISRGHFSGTSPRSRIIVTLANLRLFRPVLGSR